MTEESFQVEPSNVLDLHNFQFEQVESLLDEFIWSCLQCGFNEASIIHGKGSGSQRELVHKILRSHSSIGSYELADGNWGKTRIFLRPT